MNVLDIGLEKVNKVENNNYFDAVYSKHHLKLCYFISKLINDDYHEAENIAQEVFMLFLEKLKNNEIEFENEQLLVSYLYQIARNLALNYNRKFNFRKLKNLVISYITPQVSEKDKYDDIETRIDFDNAVNQLSDVYREVLILRYVCELSFEKIAQILNISEGTVKSRFFNGSIKLTKILKNYNQLPKNGETND